MLGSRCRIYTNGSGRQRRGFHERILTDLHDSAGLGEDVVDSVARDHHHAGQRHHQSQGLSPGGVDVIFPVPAVNIFNIDI